MCDFEVPDLEIPVFAGVPYFRNEKSCRKTMRTTSKKCRRKTPDKRTIHDRLTDLYLEYAEKGSVEEGPFIKYNFLEELVIRENIKYISLDMYPNKEYFFSIKEQFDDAPTSTTSLKEEEIKAFCDSIDLEEIPAYLFYLMMPNSSMLYDRHMILHITKFATDVENDRPIHSMFLLLKPTDNICRELIRHEIREELGKEAENMGSTSVSAIGAPDPIVVADEEEKKYKKTIFELAGPLYLDLRSDKASQLVFLLEFYNSLFASITIKRLFNKKGKKMPSFQFYQTDRKLPESEKHAFFEHIDEFKILPEPISDLKNRLNSILRKREIIIEEPDNSEYFARLDSILAMGSKDSEFKEVFEHDIAYLKNRAKSSPIFVERFKFITKTGKTEEVKTLELNVYSRDSVFCVGMKYDNYVYSNVLEKDLAEKVGDRNALDKFIFFSAQSESEQFTLAMTIYHTNKTDSEFKILFSCGCLEDMGKNNSVYSDNFQTAVDQMEKMDITVTENPERQQLGQKETEMQIENPAQKISSPLKFPAEVSETQQRRHKKERILYAQSGGSES